jgi:ubiquitin carboxyl-terminal hydrolase 34
MSALGQLELEIVLDTGFLRRCLEILVAEAVSDLGRGTYARLIRFLERGRKVSYRNLFQLISVLFQCIDVNETVYDDRQRTQDSLGPSGDIPLSQSELHYLTLYWTKTRSLVWLQKMLEVDENREAVDDILTVWLQTCSDQNVFENIQRTIMNGICLLEPADRAAAHFSAAITFCKQASHQPLIKELIARTAAEVDTIGSYGGKENFEFFHDLYAIQNSEIQKVAGPHYFQKRVLETASMWSPPLLVYWYGRVRMSTVEFLQRIIYRHGPNPDTGDDQLDRQIVKAAMDVGHACLVFLNKRYIDQNAQVLKAYIEPCVLIIDKSAIYFEDDTEFQRSRSSMQSFL